MVATAAQKRDILKRLAQRRAGTARKITRPSYATQPRDAKGRWTKVAGAIAEKHKDKIDKAKTLAVKHEAQLKDLVVNAGGTLGSVIGGRVAGPVGALAGDLIGAMVTRKVVHVATVAHSAHQKLKQQEGFARAKRLEQLKKLGAQTLSDLKSEAVQEKLGDDVTGDITGWAIGNASAKAMGAMIPAIAGIPLKGAGVAMVTVPKLVKLRQRLKKAAAGTG